MQLAQAILDASRHEMNALSRYVAGEVTLEEDDADNDGTVDITPEGIAAAMRAWAYMQQHQADGDV